jgi:hypothetical protein
MSVKDIKQEEDKSMNDITVVITGMILLMAPIAYDYPNGSKTIHAAVAVNATDPKSSYGIDLPQHFATLVFTTADLDTAIGYKTRLVADNMTHLSTVELHGDRVQLGTFDGSVCTAILNDPTQDNATITNSIRDLPRMEDLIKSDLADDTHPINADFSKPINDDFSKIKPGKVAGWFEIPSGRLRAIHSANPQDDEVLFHPPHRNAMVAPEVRWHVKGTQGVAGCVLVTPFTGVGQIAIPFLQGKTVSVSYKNEADKTTGEVMPGVGFDFEVLYGLYKDVPKMPPIPFSIDLLDQTPESNEARNAVSSSGHNMSPAIGVNQGQGKRITNATTGVNCGPATIPSGG